MFGPRDASRGLPSEEIRALETCRVRRPPRCFQTDEQVFSVAGLRGGPRKPNLRICLSVIERSTTFPETLLAFQTEVKVLSRSCDLIGLSVKDNGRVRLCDCRGNCGNNGGVLEVRNTAVVHALSWWEAMPVPCK